MSWRTKLGIALVAFVLPLPAFADEVRIINPGQQDTRSVALPNPQPIRNVRTVQSRSVFGSSSSANSVTVVGSSSTIATAARDSRGASTYNASFRRGDSVRVGVGLGVGVGTVYGPGYYAAPSVAYVAPSYYAPTYCAPAPVYYSCPTPAVYYGDPYCYPSYRAGFFFPRIGLSFFGRIGHGLRLGFRF